MQKFRRLFVYVPLVLCLVVIVFIVYSFWEQQTGPLKVSFLDVGQGDAIFIQTPSKKQILIDSGIGAQVLSELGQVMMPWDRTLDMVIATHPDKDHIGGFPDIFQNYTVASVVDTGFDTDKDIARMYRSAVLEEGSKYVQVNYPETVALDDGVTLYFLRSVPFEELNTNEGSLAIRLDYGETSFLFTGDAGIGVEFDLIKNQYQQLDVDVLKLGHHGSKTSSSELFLRATTPNMAVISAGINNSYGHPSKEVVDRLDFFNIPRVCTCDEGRITFISDGSVLNMKK